MKSMIGDTVQLSVFGESHGEAIGFVLNGLAPGIALDMDDIHQKLDLRKPKGKISTARQETDEPKIVSGYFNGKTTGTPLCVLFENSAKHSSDYDLLKDTMRPSHADYSGHVKYEGFNDYRGGGHFSGRLTTALVCAGTIARQILTKKGITIGSHILSLGEIKDIALDDLNEEALKTQLDLLNTRYFPVLDDDAKQAMLEKMEACAEAGDSIGGIIEAAIVGMPCGIGEPMFDSLESVLAHYLFSVPAIKGVEFGLGFGFDGQKGSQANDSFYYEGETVKTKTNHNGGINGGISNGMPITIRCAVKPTPSIYKEQETINIATKENTLLTIKGRHDPAIIHRARVVIDSVIALALLDKFSERYGYLWMKEE